MNRYSEKMKLWLFDLAHGNLNENDIVAGFIEHYILFDCSMQDVKRDIIFHTNYGDTGCITALTSLSNALKHVVCKEGKVIV